MTKKITLLALSVFAMCWQISIAQTAQFSLIQTAPWCTNQCIGAIDESIPPVGAGFAIASWEWTIISPSGVNPATIEFPNVATPGDICITDPGIYTITLKVTGNVISGGNQSTSPPIQIEVFDCPDGLNAGFSGRTEVCVGECVTYRDTSNGTPIQWFWEITPSTSRTFPDDPDGVLTPDEDFYNELKVCFIDIGPVDFSFEVRDADGKVSKITKTLMVNDIPTITATDDTIVDLGTPALLGGVQTGATFYSWSPKETVTDPSSLNTFVYPIETTDYEIKVEDGAGCSAVDTVRVFLNFAPTIGVPTAFSPNGDGNNDILVVEGLALEKCIFKVYNRYGIQIFESTRQKNGWDGNSKGKPESPGVYYWTLEYGFNTGQEGTLSGNTTLVR